MVERPDYTDFLEMIEVELQESYQQNIDLVKGLARMAMIQSELQKLKAELIDKAVDEVTIDCELLNGPREPDA